MEPKKYPKANLNRSSSLFFVIGLAVTLFLTWIALEYKSDEKEIKIEISHREVQDLREDVPITEIIRAEPPPPPPSAPSVIEVIEDENEIEETVIKSTEVSQETVVDDPIIAVEDVDVDEVEEEITVPFAVIENIPVFPGCENGTDEEKRACFQKKVQEHVRDNFKYPDLALEMGIQGKVFVQFIIDSKGHVTQIRTRGPDRLLEKEAKRIIASLPQMTPGKQRGKSVNMPYSIPINFKLL
ncbi:energy transducer TonB [Flagellimonas allohymeniacidonis]|uniref:Energy transducer TonB n=1 Tax=Flagellimonas allohymeniacidonis TaxID=2517819 RepID=A0A4Q8QFI6_9FLAO|nr:energy transducer TonB [Allomuricauda hymeniacidonis]TAI47313.1 energy transducer TonB [Allomuricauda hymeniacidonis]